MGGSIDEWLSSIMRLYPLPSVPRDWTEAASGPGELLTKRQGRSPSEVFGRGFLSFFSLSLSRRNVTGLVLCFAPRFLRAFEGFHPQLR